MLGFQLLPSTGAFFQTCGGCALEAYHSDLWSDFALAFAISVDSVVLGWVVIMFQSRNLMLVELGRACSACIS